MASGIPRQQAVRAGRDDPAARQAGRAARGGPRLGRIPGHRRQRPGDERLGRSRSPGAGQYHPSTSRPRDPRRAAQPDGSWSRVRTRWSARRPARAWRSSASSASWRPSTCWTKTSAAAPDCWSRRSTCRRVSLLNDELKSPIRTRRLRGLAIARTIDAVEGVEGAVIEMLQDEDHLVRMEAAVTLGKSRQSGQRGGLDRGPQRQERSRSPGGPTQPARGNPGPPDTQ